MVIQAGFLDSHSSWEQFSTQGKIIAYAGVEIPLPNALWPDWSLTNRHHKMLTDLSDLKGKVQLENKALRLICFQPGF